MTNWSYNSDSYQETYISDAHLFSLKNGKILIIHTLLKSVFYFFVVVNTEENRTVPFHFANSIFLFQRK